MNLLLLNFQNFNKKDRLLNDDSVPYDTRRRICQASEEGALKFQHAAPTADDRKLTDAAYLSNWRHCYGLNQPELYPGTRCVLGWSGEPDATGQPECTIYEGLHAHDAHANWLPWGSGEFVCGSLVG